MIRKSPGKLLNLMKGKPGRSNDLGFKNLDKDGLPDPYSRSMLSQSRSMLRKIEYGGRILLKKVNDQECKNPQNQGVCKELEWKNRIALKGKAQFQGTIT